MDQYTRKTQRTRVFNPAPKTPIAVATGAIPPKPCTGLKRKFDEALDAKLEEYLARKAGSKKPKFDDKLQQLIRKANTGNVDVSRKVDEPAASIKGQGAVRKGKAPGNAHNSKKEEDAGRGKHKPPLHGANRVSNNKAIDNRAETEGSKSRYHSSENRHFSSNHKTNNEREFMKATIIEKSRSQKAQKDNGGSRQNSSHSDVTERKRHHSELNSSAKKDYDKNSSASALGDMSRKVDQLKKSTKCQDPSRKEKSGSTTHHSVKKDQVGFANALESVSKKVDRLKSSTRCHGDSGEKKAPHHSTKGRVDINQGKQDQRTQTTDDDSSSACIAKRTNVNSSRKRSSDSDPHTSDKNKMAVKRKFANQLSHNLPSQGNRPGSLGATVNGSSKVSTERRSNEESIPKSPRKVIVIDIPTAVSQKPIIIKGNRTDQQVKMVAAPKIEKAEKKECVKPVKTKPTKSLRERLASKAKFTFGTATHSNPVRKNMAIIKERLAQLTQNKKAAEIVARDQENNIIGNNQEALNNNHITSNKGEQRGLRDETRRLREELPQPVENKGCPPQRNVEVVPPVTSNVMDKLHITNDESLLLPGSENSSSSGSDESSSSDSGDSSSEDDGASSDNDSDSSSSEDEEEYDNNEKLGQMLEENIGRCPNDDEVFPGQLATNDLCQDLDLSCSFSEEEI
ncbi:unnamed protein product [Hermetia illucens]|uniref:Uncharacterized protein n=1 Tax=Hermetia illucens TaxID=343691 RepID=A0A7R8UT78_HERIL|nr:unnamed protein product [Hermetia illucens]